MRPRHVMIFAACLAATPALAQPASQTPAPRTNLPREDGNRANGRDYEPTPNEVIPRERAAGILPPASQQQANDRALEKMDKDLLRSQGMSTTSVPDLTKHQ